MRSDDVTGNTKPQPHTLALTLGSEEGGKDMLEMFWGDAWTGISNLNPEVLPALGSLDAEFAHGAIVYHSLIGIIEDMQKHLVQLWRIEQDRGQIWREVRLDCDIARAQVVSFPFQGLRQDVVEILRMFIWPWLFDKGEQISDCVRGALCFIENAQGDLA